MQERWIKMFSSSSLCSRMPATLFTMLHTCRLMSRMSPAPCPVSWDTLSILSQCQWLCSIFSMQKQYRDDYWIFQSSNFFLQLFYSLFIPTRSRNTKATMQQPSSELRYISLNKTWDLRHLAACLDSDHSVLFWGLEAITYQLPLRE